MTENLTRLLLRLNEAGAPAILWGRLAKPYDGPELERLLAHGVLVEQAPATEWDVCESCECSLDVRPIRLMGDRYIAPCPHDRRSDRALDAWDLRSFRIAPAALIRALATASRFTDEPKEVVPDLWYLGLTDTTRAVFVALTRSAIAAQGLVANLRLLDRSSPISLVAPAISAANRLRFAEAGILHVALDDCIDNTTAQSFAIDRSKLEPAPDFSARLVIHRGAQTVVLDGTSRPLSEQSFMLLMLMAERVLKNDPFVTTHDIEDCIWGTIVHRVSRDARDVVRELREALAANSNDPSRDRRLIENVRGRGWRLALPAEEIHIRR